MLRGKDVIGQSLMQMLGQIGSGLGQYAVRNKTDELVGGLVGASQQQETPFSLRGGVSIQRPGTPIFSEGNAEILTRLAQLDPNALRILEYLQPETQVMQGFRGSLDAIQKSRSGEIGVQNIRPPMPETESLSGQDWQTAYDDKGKPVVGNINGVKTIKQWKYERNPMTGQIEKIFRDQRLDASSGGGFPSLQLIPTDQGYVNYDRRKGEFTPISGETKYKLTPTEVKTQLMNLKGNLASVQSIKEIVNKEPLTGPIVGRARQFGTQFYSDEEATRLKARLAQLRTVIYGLSGKQINEAEQEWLKNEVLPNMTNPTANFEETLNEFEKWLTRRIGDIENEFPGAKPKATTGKYKILSVE